MTTATKNDTREVLANPFKVGEQIVIPAGTVFTSTAPTLKGRQKVKRAHKVTISEAVPAHLAPRNSEKGSKSSRPPTPRPRQEFRRLLEGHHAERENREAQRQNSEL